MTPLEIRRLRGALGLRQDQMGALLGVHAATISRWETPGAIKPSVWHAQILATIGLGVRHRPVAADVALGFLSVGRPALALGALLGPAAATAIAPAPPAAEPRRAPRGPRRRRGR